jgi:4-amino-4-deoxy-L-arabinose transferase-like glycosyltransferase
LWSALILQTSLIYFAMARMLTTDILLTQFVAWAVYFFWRSWRSLDDDGAAKSNRANRTKRFLAWHLAGWAATACGFLTKGPVAFVIPLVCLATLLIYRRRDDRRRKTVLVGSLAGLALFLAIVAPWFCAVACLVPKALDYMVYGQAIGHALGTTIRNRHGSALYFSGVLFFGLLPWTWLLGWLWRRAHWRALSNPQREAWLLLCVWTLFTFGMFSLTRAKLAPYILPIFPALSVLIAFRFFNLNAEAGLTGAPRWAWQLCLISPLVVLACIPFTLVAAYHVETAFWMKWQAIVAATGAVVGWWFGKRFDRTTCAPAIAGLSALALVVTAARMSSYETDFKSNQTLKPLGAALREQFQPGDQIVCWGRLPQGLPFYAQPVISGENRPYLGGMPLNQVPFEFPGNRERFGALLVPDESALIRLLAGQRRVLVVGFSGTFARVQELLREKPLRMITRVGQWELFANR